ncbi:MAG: EAL domain-containing response regulator [Cyanobacteria bacterium]|nr:EAL domain-containing response regulator [Cyanobacteriota bacterium]
MGIYNVTGIVMAESDSQTDSGLENDRKRHKVLVIEDDEFILDIVSECLEAEGFEVRQAPHGQAGLALAHQIHPDLIICDVSMPYLNGYEVLKKLRENCLIAATPFIFLTAKADRPDIRKGMVLGADDYLTKPFTQDELLEAVKAQLNKFEIFRQSFSPAHNSELGSNDQQVFELKNALENSEFELFYQPQIDLASGSLIGAEALLRWNSPTKGYISPAQFIPVAEETGFILELGQWVLTEVCHQFKTWQSQGLQPLRVAVNLSSLQFEDPNLEGYITRLLQEADIAPQYLEVELTESLLVKDVESTVQRLSQLRAMAITVAIDDFGTGYASLGYLQHFPFDILKLDRCFISDVDRNSSNAAIVSAVIKMAHDLGLKVIAEGVETESERHFLREHGCDAMQGYLASRPLSVEDFGQFRRQIRS